MSYWETYNKKLQILSKEMKLYNSLHKFNYIEQNFYNHIRDLTALIIAIEAINKKINILDFGSNITAWSNLQNKLENNNINVTIYDPFANKNKTSDRILGTYITIINNLEYINNSKFDLTIFGSVSQYIPNFFEEIDQFKNIFSPLILFTHTPLSVSKEFKSKQNTDFKGIQIIRSFEKLRARMEKKNYKLIFKSTLPKEAASVEDKYLSQIIYANILFKINE
tara:strand:+ start:571 stop:1239 length:669 start_codon:yes stop_codon:yes gene_type:complete